MATLRCKSCGGEYQDVSPDGLRYFHVCPPLEICHVDRAGALSDVERKDVQPGDKVLSSRFVPRPNHRDENVIVSGYDKAGNPITAAKSAGAGVEKL